MWEAGSRQRESVASHREQTRNPAFDRRVISVVIIAAAAVVIPVRLAWEEERRSRECERP